MKKLDLVGIGYPSIDKIIKLSSTARLGETSIIVNENSQETFFGGCAVNIVYLLSHFDSNCGLVMTVGDDFESSGYEKFLSNQNISLELVRQINHVSTSYTTLLEDPEGNHMTLFYPGPMSSERFKPYDLNKMDTRYGLITIGEMQGNIQFLDTCISKNIPIIFSMKGDFSSLNKEYLIKVFNNSELIFMNNSEYQQLQSILPDDVLSYLKNDKLQAIVVTDGSNGSVIYSKNGRVKIPAVKDITVKDPAGGGDAYIAGFLKEYLIGNRDYLECGISGSVLSSFIIEEYGCLVNIPSKNRFDDRRKKLMEDRGIKV